MTTLTNSPPTVQELEVDCLPAELLGPQLEVAFCRFVGSIVGLETLQTTPGVYKDGQLNSDWVTQLVDSRLREVPRPKDPNLKVLRPIASPGQLKYDPDTKERKAVEESSPIGQVAKLSKDARELLNELSDKSLTADEEKEFLRSARAALVAIYNGYATTRFNGQREVVNGSDFRGVTLRYLAGISLVGIRVDLIRTAEQTRRPNLFDRCAALNKGGIRTPNSCRSVPARHIQRA